MAFGHGNLARVYANGYTLSSWLREVSGAGSAAAEDATTLTKTDKVYQPGLLDGTLRLEGLFDGNLLALDERLAESLGLAASIFTWLPQGDVFGAPGYGIRAVQTSYDVQTLASGLARVSAQAQAGWGLRSGLVAHALALRTTSANGTALDHGASTTAYSAGYLQVLGVAGSGGTIKVQHSADNVTFADLLTFTAATAVGAEVKGVEGTVNRYVRASWTIEAASGVNFNLVFVRK